MTEPPSNLPTPPTPFIGRETIVDEICTLVQWESVRLLTLTGPGGVGKTRVAIEVARRLQPEFEDGVWFVPLAPVTNPELVVPAIAEALGLKDAGSTPLIDTVQRHLRERTLLLVLDNFEQVGEAAPQVSDMLADAPGAQVIVTARSPMRIYGEHEFSIPPMDFHGVEQGPVTNKEGALHDPSEVGRYESVQLFVARARAVDPRFTLTRVNASEIAEICRRLDGLPLALELAATRLRLFTPKALLSRLEKSLPLLTGGARNLPDRQRTLYNSIAWSYNLLDPAEQKLFALMPVFVGGCTLEAVEALAGPGAADQGSGSTGVGDLLPPPQPLIPVHDRLESLIKQNLLRRRDKPDGEPRFWMLATIREYAWERLSESGEEHAARDAHAAFFLAMAEQFYKELRGPKQGEWLDRLEFEHDNLRAALQWYLVSEQGEQAAHMGACLWWFWQARGYVSEGRQWLARVLAAAPADALDHPGSFRERLAAVYNGAGSLAGAQSDYEAATASLATSLQITRELGDKRSVARTLNNMGIFLSHQGAYAEAERCFQESFELKQEIGDQIGLSSAYNRLAEIAHVRANYDQAISLYNTSLKLRRERGDKIWLADTLQNLAELHYDLGDFARSTVLARESMALAQEMGYKEMQAILLIRMAAILCEHGEYGQAAQSLDTGLELAHSIGDPAGIARALKGLGQVAAARQDYDKAIALFQDALSTQVKAREYNADMAATLEWLATIYLAPEQSGNADAGARAENARRTALILGAVEARREEMGAPIPPINRARYEQAVVEAQARLGQAAFETAWNTGRAMPFDQAAMLALQEAPGTRDEGAEISASLETDPRSPIPDPSSRMDLTEREVEVLRLMAAGLTNKDIADKLVLSPRTVQAHLYKIFNKLDVTTRSAATRFAMSHGLA